MPSQTVDNQMEKYNAYGTRGWVTFLFWALPFSIAIGVGISGPILGCFNRTLLSLSLVPVLATSMLWGWFVVMLTTTALSLTTDGISYQGTTVRQAASYLFPFSFQPWTVHATWNEIYEISWFEGKKQENVIPVGFTPKLAPNPGTCKKELLHIKTKNGDIIFGVMFNARANTEIMEKILARRRTSRSRRSYERI